MFEDGQRVGCVGKNVPAHDCIEKLARTELTDIRLDASNVRDPFGGSALAQFFESARSISIDVTEPLWPTRPAANRETSPTPHPTSRTCMPEVKPASRSRRSVKG